MTNPVDYELNGDIATITMHSGKVNAMSIDLIDAINVALDRAEQDVAIVVLVGQQGVFSAGYDLKVFQADMETGVEMVKAGSTLCRRLLSFPYPVVGVCTGHAVAQGCFTLLSCDYRVGVKGPYSLGLNEVAIGMIMHHFGIELPRSRLIPAAFYRAVVNAEMYDPEAAVDIGFLDKVVDESRLMDDAYAEARRLSQLNLPAYKATKLKVRAGLLKTLDDAIEKDYQEQMAMLKGKV